MSEFRFAETIWLHATWAVMLCTALLVIFELRGRALLDRWVSPFMQLRLVHKTSLLRRLMAIALFAAALISLVVALMRPQWGRTIQAVTRVDSQIMICLDVSKSMLAEDVVPNRLERAKAEIDSLLGLMDADQQVGLIAFAGKATVMCPMTTDFGFLRLLLAEATPNAVGLGGSRIGDAIRKATDGFREAGDVNRLILLITDGEDHDSFPLDAATAAQEKGIRIVSVGFGDEVGSKIEISDPTTGARSFVKDRDGTDVISRLDGATLREIALRTEGAYIPAGTGALDLQSIYDAHIRTLLQGSDTQEERVIRNEGYQWCVLLGLILFIVSMLVNSSFTRPLRLSSPQIGLGMLFVWMIPQAALAQPEALSAADANASSPPSAASGSAESAVAPGENSDEPSDESQLPPRTLYNRGVQFISADPDRAERLLTEARNAAGVDGELRFRSLYNLGWVDVSRADALLESEPEQALKHLEIAAGRFREALRLRPDNEDARANLEILSRRILQLRDSIARRAPQDYATRLDGLIEALRAHQAELQHISASIDPTQANLGDYRSLFRKLSVDQRHIISDFEKFSAEARAEQLRLEQETANPSGDATQAGDDQIRATQLSAMLAYTDRCVQRLNRARSFARRTQAERAFVRWSAGLTDAKRGRDQLRNPIEVLGILLNDATELAQLTQQMAAGTAPQLDASSQAEKPAWLSTEFLHDTQLAMTERTQELKSLLTAGVENATRPSDSAAQTPIDENANSQAAEPSSPETDFLLENIRSAIPLLDSAEQAFGRADELIQQELFGEGNQQQLQAINALMNASEFFYDLRRLIELMHQDEVRVQTVTQQLDPSRTDLLISAAAELQSNNLARTGRLERLLSLESEKLSAATGPTSPATSGNATSSPQAESEQPPEMEAQKQRLELARELLGRIQADMQQASSAFQELVRSSISDKENSLSGQPAGDSRTRRPPSPLTTKTRESSAAPPVGPFGKNVADETLGNLPLRSVENAVRNLEELRRLFFTIIEHLRETAQRQADLNDRVSQMAGQQDRPSSEHAPDTSITDAGSEDSDDASEIRAEPPSGTQHSDLGLLSLRQAQLKGTAAEIANALQEQGQAMESQPQAIPDDASADAGQARQDAQTLLKAAGLVRQGSELMESAEQGLAAALNHGQMPAGGDDPTERDLAADDRSHADILETANDSQRGALQKLIEALQLLDDRQSGQDQNQDQNQDQQQDDSQQDGEQANSPSPSQNMDAGQMLQAIRDREAQRRQDQQRAQALSSGSVEKDW